MQTLKNCKNVSLLKSMFFANFICRIFSGSGSDTEYEQPWTSHESPLFCDKLARTLAVDKKVFDSRKFYDYLTETLGPMHKDE